MFYSRLPFIVSLLLPRFPLTFCSTLNGLLLFIAFNYSPVDWDGLFNYRRDVPWKSILNLDASFVTFKFVSGSIDELKHIFHPKYQVESHSAPWFSATFAAVVAHNNPLFFCTNIVNFSCLRWSLDRQLIVAKEFLKLLNLLC